LDYGLIVDVETTGLDPEKDKIIEIGLLEFAVYSDEEAKITSMYSQLEDPGTSLSPEIIKITGITETLLQGKTIDWSLVGSYFSQASIVIAHNMEFDRAFLMKKDEIKKTQCHWACSIRHIDWKKYGFKSQSLNYLACDQGFVNPFPHRALFDCATTFQVIKKYIHELVHNSYQKQYEIQAVGAPFELKEKLKQNGYFWNPRKRLWCKILFADQLQGERDFLKEEIYRGNLRHEESLID
tara:strand:- start:142 stop:858 length:717 start_codon:yes stop_codon:yes gene_type:complete